MLFDSPITTIAGKLAREAAKQYPMEQGSGANTHTYFVCNQLGDTAMTPLPDIRPEQISAARDLRRVLTGSLSSAVSNFPPFPWPEAVLLRAQIARIAATTVLAPTGWLSQEEDDDGNAVITASEEPEALTLPDGEPEEWLANWVHRCAPCYGRLKPIHYCGA